jgi:hypothetical protein
VEGVDILRAGDKGLSVGEASWMSAIRVNIKGAGIAVASKDNSAIEIRYIEIDAAEVAFAAYQKKPGFGPAQIDAENVVLNPKNTPHLIERGSHMDLNWYAHEGKLEDVAASLYGEEEPEALER